MIFEQEKGLNTLNSVSTPFFIYEFAASSNTSTAFCCITSVLNVYVCRVVVISLCPNRSITVFGLTPFSARIVPYNKTGLKHSKRLCKGFV